MGKKWRLIVNQEEIGLRSILWMKSNHWLEDWKWGQESRKETWLHSIAPTRIPIQSLWLHFHVWAPFTLDPVIISLWVSANPCYTTHPLSQILPLSNSLSFLIIILHFPPNGHLRHTLMMMSTTQHQSMCVLWEGESMRTNLSECCISDYLRTHKLNVMSKERIQLNSEKEEKRKRNEGEEGRRMDVNSRRILSGCDHHLSSNSFNFLSLSLSFNVFCLIQVLSPSFNLFLSLQNFFQFQSYQFTTVTTVPAVDTYKNWNPSVGRISFLTYFFFFSLSFYPSVSDNFFLSRPLLSFSPSPLSGCYITSNDDDTSIAVSRKQEENSFTLNLTD